VPRVERPLTQDAEPPGLDRQADPPPASGPDPLPYSATRRTRRWWPWLLVVLALVIVLPWASDRWGPTVRGKLSFLRVQRDIRRQAPPPGTLMLLMTGWGHYESGDSVAGSAALIATPDYTAAFDYDPTGGKPVLPFAFGRTGTAVDGLLAAGGVRPRTMTCFTRTAPLLFFGELRGPAGRRLVALSYRGRSSMNQDHARQTFQLTADLYRPATLWQPMSNVGSQPCDLGPFDDRGGRAVVRVMAGQLDPADPSRFTLGYTLDTVAGTIAGQLRPDGAGIDLQVRDGPLGHATR
jgi:hypothetical protein